MHHSEQLRTRIAARIKLEGAAGMKLGAHSEQVRCLTFHDYMAMCLYDPDYGYYQSGKVRVGKTGDFYTSSAVGSIMGEKLAGYIAQQVEGYGGCADAAEWGAGTGRLSHQIIHEWEQAGHEWIKQMNYSVIDGNPVHLEEAQRVGKQEGRPLRLAGLRYMLPKETEACDWQAKPTILLANELLDAFPVHRIVKREGQLWELGVTFMEEELRSEGGTFQYAYLPLSDPLIEESLRADGIHLREGQELEVNLAAERFIDWMADRIAEGMFIIVDYGHEAVELSASHRMRGTLLCYKDHRAHDDPFQFIGEQDITAHVNFTACRRAAEKAGWQVIYYDTQKQFLLDQGLLGDLTAHDGSDPFGEAARRNRSIRQLLLGDSMSESFKVMVLQK
ncbi:SAM-dependent methyltransferase [Paenibacillus baekrokdamisoli]|uniref:SAM-dependent methyltransferase n=2 Tax=Paenibacillus baekrokdamisoli TaxID=1712516 RepID=A0A3G9J653_9BACL|nr:SAM-dependent methyltransferase [Paenibacillus baekrokdamisoli]MBB3070236.1 SAM-dependent MidA family methyltransferase [Paenibacillus baekrokdamisoli]BBH21241.1 SAM-dependent methyltransferase [Paenibacillus baekrokdamisoli]